jgi:hypothetical protein
METSKLPINEEQLIKTAVTPISMIRQTDINMLFCAKTKLGRKYQQK